MGQQCGSVAYASPSEPSGAHGLSPNNALYFNDPASSVTLPSRHTDVPITSPSETSVKNVLPNILQNGASQPAMGSLPQAQNAHSDFTGNESSLSLPVKLYASQEQSLADPDLDLPPYDLLYALVDLYFEHINSWCPIFHRRSTLDTLFGPSPLEEADRMVFVRDCGNDTSFLNR